MRPLPPYEQATLDLDLPVLQAWAEDHPDLVAKIAADHAAFDSNVGHVLLVVEIHDHTAVRRVQAELVPLLRRPEHLRVRTPIPEPVDLEPLSDGVWALDGNGTHITTTWPDPTTGMLHVTLDRIDPAFTARIEALAPDRIHVLPDPQGPAAPLASRELPPYEQEMPVPLPAPGRPL
ncbi:hypothetical protein [Kribbella italica]|uniref:Uncharacterized protein n=1 Tax=Kribbella italica TaxID=1540520 RepID=A0A7W9J465_9ACTN|nr:hypothetical protein [Kribbella italica]MBB5834820.1 hypothetical protein [Kribbella italica]